MRCEQSMLKCAVVHCTAQVVLHTACAAEEALHASRRRGSAKVLPRKLSKVGKAVLAILRAPPPKHACIGISLCIHAQVLLKLVDSQCMM